MVYSIYVQMYIYCIYKRLYCDTITDIHFFHIVILDFGTVTLPSATERN